ncbi:uncharacterized protein LOC132259668 [Phlebotomus argentipes]|uniref:uncharacterized protein LOC132259668 n=1 Tax=Phlebotomus argentipes TaxID=94469 RepID=UPI0028932C6F|nr:uncharacterized protein LOC132259668 [Phlebotomus argentipes]
MKSPDDVNVDESVEIVDDTEEKLYDVETTTLIPEEPDEEAPGTSTISNHEEYYQSGEENIESRINHEEQVTELPQETTTAEHEASTEGTEMTTQVSEQTTKRESEEESSYITDRIGIYDTTETTETSEKETTTEEDQSTTEYKLQTDVDGANYNDMQTTTIKPRYHYYHDNSEYDEETVEENYENQSTAEVTSDVTTESIPDSTIEEESSTIVYNRDDIMPRMNYDEAESTTIENSLKDSEETSTDMLISTTERIEQTTTERVDQTTITTEEDSERSDYIVDRINIYEEETQKATELGEDATTEITSNHAKQEDDTYNLSEGPSIEDYGFSKEDVSNDTMPEDDYGSVSSVVNAEDEQITKKTQPQTNTVKKPKASPMRQKRKGSVEVHNVSHNSDHKDGKVISGRRERKGLLKQVTDDVSTISRRISIGK